MSYATANKQDFQKTAERISKVGSNIEPLIGSLKPGQQKPFARVLAALLGYFARVVEQAKLEKVTLIDASLTAWLARNILELNIWLFYVLHSEENAKRLHYDMVLDAEGFNNAVAKMFSDSGNTQPNRDDLKIVIDETKRLLKLPKGFLKSGEEAASLELGEVFKMFNPILSKMVHPTAFGLFAANPENQHIIALGIAMALVKLALSTLESLQNEQAAPN